MKLLLDTHIWLWSVLQPHKIGARARRELERPGNELWLSPISVWEVIVLHEKGRLEAVGGISAWIEAALDATPVRDAPVTHEVALESQRVSLAHRDPADRFLVATARTFALTLVTADRRLIESKAVPVLASR